MAWLNRKPREPESPPEAVQKSSPGPHASVERADPYSFQVAHRRQAWLLKIAAGIIIVLGFCLVSSLNALASLWPLKETKIALVRVDAKDDRVYRIEPLTQDTEGFDLVMEAAARRYVRNLLTIDAITQTERFKEAFRMTDDGYFKRFQDERFAAVEDAINSGLNRSIVIESVDRLDTTDDVFKYAVDFVQVDERKGELIERRKLRAYLNMTTRPQEVSDADKYENPLGITVLDLVLKERGNS